MKESAKTNRQGTEQAPRRALKKGRSAFCFGLLFCLAAAGVRGSENAPFMPFAQWTSLPKRGELRAAAFYQESEAYHIWVGNRYQDITWHKPDGERYGIDITQGFISLDYGLTERWAADLSFGYTTVGWRAFANYGPVGRSYSTDGFMDTSFGVRYKIAGEGEENPTWMPQWAPSLVFRAGAVVPGSFKKSFPFAPGNRSASIQPQLLARKHFGWPGLGAYLDAAFRWNRTTANDQYLLGLGLFQQIKGWELDVGYRRLGSVSGDNIRWTAPDTLYYPRSVREQYDSIEAGFSYTTPRKRIRYGFYSRTIFDGANTDRKFWVGGYVSAPFQLFD